MRIDYITFDPAGAVFLICVILLAIGTIPFTPVAVAALLMLSQIHLTFRWDRR